MAHFRIQTKAIFLTYPHCEFDLNDFNAHLCTLLPIDYAIIARETHADGTPHIHAAIRTGSRTNIRNNRFFDYLGNHPNIQPVKHWDKSTNYLRKGGTFIEYFDSEAETNEYKLSILDICNTYTDKCEWLAYCLERRVPFPYAETFWRCTHIQSSNTIYDNQHEGVVIPRLLAQPIRDDRYTYVLVGATGIGKTTWAKTISPKPALFITHLDQLKELEDHKSIIFDDMIFKHLPVQGQIHLVDYHNTNAIHRRYGITEIPAFTYKFFLCNEYPFEEHPAIKRRIILIDLINNI